MRHAAPSDPGSSRGLRRPLVGLTVLLALAGLIAFAVHASRQLVETALTDGLMVIGAGGCIAVLAARLYAGGGVAILEAVWDAACAITTLFAAVLSAFWHGLLSLLGWD